LPEPFRKRDRTLPATRQVARLDGGGRGPRADNHRSRASGGMNSATGCRSSVPKIAIRTRSRASDAWSLPYFARSRAKLHRCIGSFDRIDPQMRSHFR
jgi:hypothetical protein